MCCLKPNVTHALMVFVLGFVAVHMHKQIGFMDICWGSDPPVSTGGHLSHLTISHLIGCLRARFREKLNAAD